MLPYPEPKGPITLSVQNNPITSILILAGAGQNLDKEGSLSD